MHSSDIRSKIIDRVVLELLRPVLPLLFRVGGTTLGRIERNDDCLIIQFADDLSGDATIVDREYI